MSVCHLPQDSTRSPHSTNKVTNPNAQLVPDLLTQLSSPSVRLSLSLPHAQLVPDRADLLTQLSSPSVRFSLSLPHAQLGLTHSSSPISSLNCHLPSSASHSIYLTHSSASRTARPRSPHSTVISSRLSLSASHGFVVSASHSRTTTSSRGDDASLSISNAHYASDIESELVEQDEPGVYITIRQLAWRGACEAVVGSEQGKNTSTIPLIEKIVKQFQGSELGKNTTPIPTDSHDSRSLGVSSHSRVPTLTPSLSTVASALWPLPRYMVPRRQQQRCGSVVEMDEVRGSIEANGYLVETASASEEEEEVNGEA
ncbi:hypothetical protein Syun_001614 [Stephania yunnanensis]|uniref:Uncharacterized protein n=1 Tax=Stephania yunnanensis TaxID=152371 RepID=A0AAP0LJT3_9MAGN